MMQRFSINWRLSKILLARLPGCQFMCRHKNRHSLQHMNNSGSHSFEVIFD